MLTAALLAIGDELVTGLTTDTNSGFLAQSLRSIGVDVAAVFSVPDDREAIIRALGRAAEDAALIITTGGLGPTADDLTTACVADFAGVALDLDPLSLAEIEARFRGRGIEMPPNNRKQAMLPRGCIRIPNPDGTAPGFVLAVARSELTIHIATLPGVPREMRRMTEGTLIPWVAGQAGLNHIASRTLSIVGLTESRIDELLEGVVDPDEARLAFRAAFPRIQVRVTVATTDPEEAEQRLDRLEAAMRARLGDHVYGTGDVGLENVVGTLLRERGLSVAVAESCTGGLIGHRITDVAGSSDYFLLGVVAYSNAMKRQLLSVNANTLAAHGAVSEEVVREMAEGVRRTAGSDFGLATSGIAGPGGGTAEKPVGTVCIAVAGPGGVKASTHSLGSRSRSWIKEMTAVMALDMLRRELLQSRLM